MPPENLTTWIEVNLDAIKNNIKRLQLIAGKPVMAVVKANAYGHGLIEVSKAAAQAGTAWLCVARIEEALRLREAGIQLPVLVLGYMMPERVPEAIKNKISVMVNSIELANAFNDQALNQKDPLHVHVKVDSGMHRLGLLPEDIKAFTQALPKFKNIHVEGLFTHFPNADDLQDITTYSHIENFSNTVADFHSLGIRPDIIHAANSAASLYFPGARFDAIRPGIAIYGLNPDIGAPLPEGFIPALTWKGRITSIKSIPAGEGIGYNYRYRTTRTERIGAASVGYADGLRRRLGNIALLGGKRINQVGGMCMDQSLWQLDGNPEAKVGDEIVFVGCQGNEQLNAEEIGRLWGSNNYDVVCGLSARVPRLYYSG